MEQVRKADGQRTDLLSAEAVAAIRDAADNADTARLTELLDPFHEADIADLLEQISPEERSAVISVWGSNFDGDVLLELDESIREEVVEMLRPERLATAVREFESDEVVDLVEGLEESRKQAILATLDAADRAAVEESLRFPEETAGRLMQREVAMVPSHWTVGQAIDYLREHMDLPDRYYHVVLVGPDMKPTGQVPLGDLLSSKRSEFLRSIADEDFRSFSATELQKDIAFDFNQYHLISAPVIDVSGRLLGVITIDDAITVHYEEAEEDMMRLAGLGDESLSDGILDTTRQRFPWLTVNLVTAIIASVVIAQFSSTIEAVVALAVLMPIIASMGGNAGTQSLTVAVRALATKDLTGSNAWRIVRREGTVGLMNGVIFAAIVGGIGIAWYGTPMLGLVLALAMVFNMLVAGLSGILVPLGLERARIDPALASGVFVTTVTDVVGFFAFLYIASIILL